MYIALIALLLCTFVLQLGFGHVITRMTPNDDVILDRVLLHAVVLVAWTGLLWQVGTDDPHQVCVTVLVALAGLAGILASLFWIFRLRPWIYFQRTRLL